MASDKPLTEHSALALLPFSLRFLVSVWVEELVKASVEPSAAAVLQNLDSLVFGGSLAMGQLSPEDQESVKDWLDEPEHEEIIRELLEEGLRRSGKTRAIPRATPDQIRIVLESQEEVGIFWSSNQLLEMTRWQVDAIIKGIMVRSEVKRATGHYDYPIRSLRRAVRADFQ